MQQDCARTLTDFKKHPRLQRFASQPFVLQNNDFARGKTSYVSTAFRYAEVTCKITIEKFRCCVYQSKHKKMQKILEIVNEVPPSSTLTKFKLFHDVLNQLFSESLSLILFLPTI